MRDSEFSDAELLAIISMAEIADSRKGDYFYGGWTLSLFAASQSAKNKAQELLRKRGVRVESERGGICG